MSETLQIAAFDGGEISFLRKGGGSGEAMLALDLSWLLVRMVKIPSDFDGDPAELAESLVKEISPFPDEPLTVSCETVAEDESGRTVVAAALPEGACGEIADALDAARLGITRVDAAAFGAMRSLWPEISRGPAGRRVVLVKDGPGTALFIMDGDRPADIRYIPPESDMRHELSLSIFRAEDFAGPGPVAEIAATSGVETHGLEAFAPVRILETDPDPVSGLAERAGEPDSLNVLPESWREVLEESRFKKKLKIFLFSAFGLWIALLLGMFLWPQYYHRKQASYEAMSKAQRSSYSSVSERKRQVEAVRSVSNHDLGALEALRVVNSAIQPNILLTKWSFKRGERLSFSGTVENGDHNEVYRFKEGLSAATLSQISGDDDDDVPYFKSVTLPRGVVNRNGKIAFDMECSFKEEGEED